VPPPPSAHLTICWPPSSSQLDRSFRAGRTEGQRIVPSPEGGPQEFLRRVYFDLIGLPPTADEVPAFPADDSSDAYERVVDRLLGGPRYGERWVRHGLDLIGYADTNGYDRVKTTTEVFLGLTLGCAHCHNHKFDPVTRYDYYQVAGFFGESFQQHVRPILIDSCYGCHGSGSACGWTRGQTTS